MKVVTSLAVSRWKEFELRTVSFVGCFAARLFVYTSSHHLPLTELNIQNISHKLLLCFLVHCCFRLPCKWEARGLSGKTESVTSSGLFLCPAFHGSERNANEKSECYPSISNSHPDFWKQLNLRDDYCAGLWTGFDFSITDAPTSNFSRRVSSEPDGLVTGRS